MRMGTGNFFATLACGAFAGAFLTTASAQEAAPDLAAPQVEAGAPASAEAVATYLRNALTVSDGLGHSAHMFPTVSVANGLKAGLANPPGPLLYNGGQIMPTIQIFNIFGSRDLAERRRRQYERALHGGRRRFGDGLCRTRHQQQ